MKKFSKLFSIFHAVHVGYWVYYQVWRASSVVTNHVAYFGPHPEIQT